MKNFSWFSSLCLMVLLLIGPVLQCQEVPKFTIDNIYTKLEESVYLLNADLHYKISDDIKEAIANAVTITFVLNISVNQARKYLWDKNTALLKQRYTLYYHAVSQRYILTYLNTRSHISFNSLDNALNVLGQLRDFPLLDISLIEPKRYYSVTLKFQLDIESLPAPLRPIAYFSNQWHLKSDVYTVPLTN